MDDAAVLGAPVDLGTLEADPHPVFHRLRLAAPICWVRSLGAWVVLTREHASAVMRDAGTFTVDDPRFSTAQVIGPSMLSLDGGEHGRHRAPFWDAFRDADRRGLLDEFIDRRARTLVREMSGTGAGDLRDAVAGPLAAAVVAELIGVPLTRTDELRTWYGHLVAGVDALSAGRPLPQATRDAYTGLTAAIRDSVAVGGSLVADAADELSWDETVSNAAVILFGGIETVDGAITTLLWHLLSDPLRWDAVHADRGLVGRAVEESLRLEPAASRVDRYATRDTEIGGASIRAGDPVIVSIAAANRDPAVFEDPDRFDLDRGSIRSHVTFAHGPHACIGAHLARQEGQAALGAVLDQLPGLRLAPGATPPTGLVFRKPRALPVRWRA